MEARLDVWGSEEPGMGATVLGCGHASHLFEVNYMEGAPQVHLHFMTDDAEYAKLGYGRLELVCHGCGASRLVLYDEGTGSRKRHVAVRNQFRDEHLKCPNKKFETTCPNYRRTFEKMDIRGFKKLRVFPHVARRRRAA